MAGANDSLSDDVQESAVSILAVTSILLMIRIFVRQRREGLGWGDGHVQLGTLASGYPPHRLLPAPPRLTDPDILVRICLVGFATAITYTARLGFGQHVEEITPEHLSAILLYIMASYCKPIHKAWTPGVEGTCISLLPLWWGGFALNLGLDLILFIEPIPIVWSLQLIPVTKKIVIIFMLSLGLLICGIAIIRVVEANKTGPDVTYDLAEPIL
ncbi:hypothetical protein RB596_007422 [Gaeumannomyces avenae]